MHHVSSHLHLSNIFNIIQNNILLYDLNHNNNNVQTYTGHPIKEKCIDSKHRIIWRPIYHIVGHIITVLMVGI